MGSKDKKYCESAGHGHYTATFRRNGLFNPKTVVYMCYECAECMKGMQNPAIADLGIRELEVPGHDE